MFVLSEWYIYAPRCETFRQRTDLKLEILLDIISNTFCQTWQLYMSLWYFYYCIIM